MISTTIAVHWGARRVDLADCAHLALCHFRALSEASPNLGRWYERANRRPKTPAEVDVCSTAALEALLAKGVNHTDYPRRPIPELGWSVGLWNGDTGGWEAGTSIGCGKYSRHVGNAVVVEISGEVPDTLATTVFRQLIEIWDADKGFVWRGTGTTQVDLELAKFETGFATRLVCAGERVGRGRLAIR